ncbi:MAG: response regulator [Calditrichaeota bacterium]|nr:response regulator [Calditrichota bacterium]
MVIDDEYDVRYVICEILINSGFTVETLETNEFLEDKLTASTFDLVITDLIMPGKRNAEIVLDIRNINPDIPILAISGGGRIDLNDNLQQAIKNGANDTLSKPFQFSELLDKVTLMIEKEMY